MVRRTGSGRARRTSPFVGGGVDRQLVEARPASSRTPALGRVGLGSAGSVEGVERRARRRRSRRGERRAPRRPAAGRPCGSPGRAGCRRRGCAGALRTWSQTTSGFERSRRCHRARSISGIDDLGPELGAGRVAPGGGRRVAEDGLAEVGPVAPDLGDAVPAADELVVDLGPGRGDLAEVVEDLRHQAGVEHALLVGHVVAGVGAGLLEPLAGGAERLALRRGVAAGEVLGDDDRAELGPDVGPGLEQLGGRGERLVAVAAHGHQPGHRQHQPGPVGVERVERPPAEEAPAPRAAQEVGEVVAGEVALVGRQRDRLGVDVGEHPARPGPCGGARATEARRRRRRPRPRPAPSPRLVERPTAIERRRPSAGRRSGRGRRAVDRRRRRWPGGRAGSPSVGSVASRSRIIAAAAAPEAGRASGVLGQEPEDQRLQRRARSPGSSTGAGRASALTWLAITAIGGPWNGGEPVAHS